MIDRRVLEKLCWTSIGTVNYQKTAKNLIRFEVFGVNQRYKLACWYGVDDYSPFSETQIMSFWADLMKKDDQNMPGISFDNANNFYKRAFKNSAVTGNKPATKYLFQKIAGEEKEALLLETAKDVAKQQSIYAYDCNCLPAEQYAEVFVYLLTQMTLDQQIKLLKTHSFIVLNIFIEWPWHDILTDMAEFAWDFLKVSKYYMLLNRLQTCLCILGHKNAESMRNFFFRSPNKFKKKIIERECRNGYFLKDLFIDEDLDMIRCIFRNMDASSRVRIGFSNGGFQTCVYLIENDKLHLFKLFIRETMEFREDMMKLKEHFKQRFSAFCKEREKKLKILDWERIFQFEETDRCTKCGKN